MKTIVVNDKTLTVDDQTAVVIEGLQGRLAVYEAAAGGTVTRTQDAGANAMAALRAEDAATKDPKTPAGAYAQQLALAWKGTSNA